MTDNYVHDPENGVPMAVLVAPGGPIDPSQVAVDIPAAIPAAQPAVSVGDDDLFSYIPEDRTPEEFEETVATRQVQVSLKNYVGQGLRFTKYNCPSLAGITMLYFLICLVFLYGTALIYEMPLSYGDHGDYDDYDDYGDYGDYGDYDDYDYGDYGDSDNVDPAFSVGCCAKDHSDNRLACTAMGDALGEVCDSDCFSCGGCPVEIFTRGKDQCQECWNGLWMEDAMLVDGACQVAGGSVTSPVYEIEPPMIPPATIEPAVSSSSYHYMKRLALLVSQMMLNAFCVVPMIASFYVAIFNAMRSNSNVQCKDFFRGKPICKLFLLGLVLGFLQMLAFAGFIIPGIWFMVVSTFTIPMFIDQPHLGICGAIRASIKGSCRRFGSLFCMVLAAIAFNIVGAMPWGLGLLVTIPVTMATHAYAYHHLFGVKGVMITVPAAEIPAPPVPPLN